MMNIKKYGYSKYDMNMNMDEYEKYDILIMNMSMDEYEHSENDMEYMYGWMWWTLKWI